MRFAHYPSESKLILGIGSFCKIRMTFREINGSFLLGGKKKVNTALEAGALLQENFHLSVQLCISANILLHRHPHHQQPKKRGQRLVNNWCYVNLWGEHILVSWGWVLESLSWLRACHPHARGSSGISDNFHSFKFRKCFQAGSGTHTQWDTPPGSETTPSCGWCVPRAHRSGRN